MRINMLWGDGIEDEYYDRYISSLKKLFKYWAYKKDPIIISQFSSYLRLIYNIFDHENACLNCHKSWIGLDNDGLLGMCDFGGYDRSFNFGNLNEYDDIRDIIYHKKRIESLKEVSERLKSCFDTKCILRGKCSGGCNVFVYRAFGNLKGIGHGFCRVNIEMYKFIKDFIKVSNTDKLNHVIKDFMMKKEGESHPQTENNTNCQTNACL